jgi:hypothetical protein
LILSLIFVIYVIIKHIENQKNVILKKNPIKEINKLFFI